MVMPDIFLNRRQGLRALGIWALSGLLSGCQERTQNEPPESPDSGKPSGGAGQKEDTSMIALTVTSSVFKEGQPVPTRYTGDGADVSPPLQWSGAPEKTLEYALVCEDPDAPISEPWVHWLVYGIPASVTSFPEGKPKRSLPPEPAGMKEGMNSFHKTDYGGPAPPRGHGTHHYYFRLYALDKKLGLPPGVSKRDLFKAMEGHVIAQGHLMGTYSR